MVLDCLWSLLTAPKPLEPSAAEDEQPIQCLWMSDPLDQLQKSEIVGLLNPYNLIGSKPDSHTVTELEYVIYKCDCSITKKPTCWCIQEYDKEHVVETTVQSEACPCSLYDPKETALSGNFVITFNHGCDESNDPQIEMVVYKLRRDKTIGVEDTLENLLDSKRIYEVFTVVVSQNWFCDCETLSIKINGCDISKPFYVASGTWKKVDHHYNLEDTRKYESAVTFLLEEDGKMPFNLHVYFEDMCKCKDFITHKKLIICDTSKCKLVYDEYI
jgi:hypothetical protein